MSELSEERITEIIISAVLQANAERRKEDISHICFCSDPQAKARHDKDHESLHKMCNFFDKIENTKWVFWFAVVTVIAGASTLALWEGMKSLVKR